VRRRPEPEALKAFYEAQKLLRETHQELLDKRYKARKALYEQQREARLKLGDVAEFGVTSVRRPVGGSGQIPSKKRWVERPPSARPQTVRLESEERPPLVDVVDEGDHLRVDLQFKDIPWPKDIVGELKEVSFKHGVLELRLKKRERKELTPEEEGALASADVEKVTAKVKEKLMLKLKKQESQALVKEKSEKPVKKAGKKADFDLKEL